MVAALGLGLAAAQPAAGAEPSREALRARAAEILADPRYQREVLEGDVDPAAAQEEAGRFQELRRAGGGASRWSPSLPSDAGVALGKTAFYVVGIAVLLTLLLAGARAAAGALAARRNAEGPEGEASAEEASEERVAPATGEAEGLAAAGRYGEALHALLLTAIARLSSALAHPPGPAVTSRELVGLLPLSGGPREAFSGLVDQVEQVLFAGATVGPEGWAAGLDRYSRIVEGRA